MDRASRGIKFHGLTRADVITRLERIRFASGVGSILELLAILDLLGSSRECVYLYTIEHFREEIALKDVADLTSHSMAGFCRYFKAHTRKSYFQYLTEVRVSYACQLLMEAELDVTRIAYASGFNNLSNFHKQFRKIMKQTPTEYQAKSLHKVPQSA
jgi:AraC-like DNA-binding protein